MLSMVWIKWFVNATLKRLSMKKMRLQKYSFPQVIVYMKQDNYNSDPVLTSAWTIAAL
ncbi:unnamed protein product [Prunus brigantina]